MVRSKGSVVRRVVPWTSKQYLVSTGQLVGQSSGSYVHDVGDDAVIAWDSSKRSGPVRKTRYCDHIVRTIKCPITTVSYYQDAAHKYRGVDVCGTNFTYSPPPIPSELPHMEALNYFASGCVPLEMNLVNSLLEIDEIPRMVKELPSLLKRFNTKHVDKAASSTFLGYQFGIKPLISDIKSIANVLRNLQKRLRWLRRNSGKPVRVSFHKTLESRDSHSKTVIPNSDIVTRTSVKTSYHAFAVIRYDVSQLLDIELALRNFSRSLGLTNLLSIAWNAIPFTWVIDQFLKVGSFLENLPSIVTLPHVIIDTGWSVTIEEHTTTSRIFFWPIDGSAVHLDAKTRRFHREPGLPVTFSAIESSLPTIKQLALDMAAVIQKL